MPSLKRKPCSRWPASPTRIRRAIVSCWAGSWPMTSTRAVPSSRPRWKIGAPFEAKAARRGRRRRRDSWRRASGRAPRRSRDRRLWASRSPTRSSPRKSTTIAGGAVGHLVEHEVPDALEDLRPRVRDLLREAMGAWRRGANGSSAPQQQQRRHAERGQPAPIGLELGEVARAVELELAAAAHGVGVGLEVLVERLLADPRRDRGEHLAEGLARRAVDDLLALALGPHRLGQPVPLAVGEEAGRRRSPGRAPCRGGRTPSAGR